MTVPPSCRQAPITFDTCSATTFDTVIRVYNSDGTKLVAMNDNHNGACPSGSASSVTFTPPVLGGTFLVSVEAATDVPSGSFTLATACATSSIPTLTCGGNATSTTANGPDNLPIGTSPESVYMFTVPSFSASSMQFDTCASSYDSVLRVFDLNSNQLAVNDNANNSACRSGSGLQSQLIFSPNPTTTTTYCLSVEGVGSASGAFTVNMACTVPQKRALELARAPVVSCGTTVANTTVGGSNVLDYGVSPERIYRNDVTATTPLPVVLSTCNTATTYASLLRVFDDAGVNMLARNDDNSGACANALPGSSLMFDPSMRNGSPRSPIGTYYISVEGFYTNTGAYSLSVGCGTSSPTASPTVNPTASPTGAPTIGPTVNPTMAPTASPTSVPTKIPTVNPTFPPITSMPTVPPIQVDDSSGGGGGGGGAVIYAVIAAVVVIAILVV